MFCFVLSVFGCASNRIAGNADTAFSVIAEKASNGIVLHFSNIPENTIHLSVSLMDITENVQVPNQVLFWDNEAFGFQTSMNELANLRQTQTLLMPFAKNGHEYIVSVYLFDNIDLDSWSEHSLSTIAGGGIFMSNNPTLHFTEENRYLVLSEKPTFSEEVQFSQDRGLFIFGAMVKYEENSFGGSGNWNELIFPINETLSGSQEHFEFAGNLPVIGSVQCTLIHENVEWLVGITNTEEVFMLF
jgi:hypothetical protein